ncbi:ATP-binding protein [Streptomyces sp. DW26H14]|uniref:ATP-binding protein n=1 Tax=Streptomyces sp. DW26H14 TaxID=3435395 RepID=UPI00403E3056
MTTEAHPSVDTRRLPPPEGEFRMSFTSTPRGARLARRLASQHLDAWGHPYESDVNTTVTLIVAELAANAVTHGRVPGRDFRLCLWLDPVASLVRVEVTDTRGDRMPPESASLPSEPDAESGRGLCLVAALASRWAVAPRTDRGPGKTVWAEVDVPA